MKNSSESFKRSFLIILAYGIGFGLAYITRLGNPTINFSFYVSEQQVYANYGLNLKDLLDLILVTPIFAIISFILLKKILDELSVERASDNKMLLGYFIFLIAVVAEILTNL